MQITLRTIIRNLIVNLNLTDPLNSPNYVLTSFFYKQVNSLYTFKRELLTVDLSNLLIGSAFTNC